ncbi:hypothetical protein [Paenibacillus cymbidii]|uniref:hypothetical protein n=1 Tax=Paenibacillus cymbidii TaxID=1639034 RepID=UPI001436A833|nr:hypothetical protein [Paenibacillus cymbidii]
MIVEFSTTVQITLLLVVGIIMAIGKKGHFFTFQTVVQLAFVFYLMQPVVRSGRFAAEYDRHLAGIFGVQGGNINVGSVRKKEKSSVRIINIRQHTRNRLLRAKPGRGRSSINGNQ